MTEGLGKQSKVRQSQKQCLQTMRQAAHGAASLISTEPLRALNTQGKKPGPGGLLLCPSGWNIVSSAAMTSTNN